MGVLRGRGDGIEHGSRSRMREKLLAVTVCIDALSERG
jgi:hypothetical protein